MSIQVIDTHQFGLPQSGAVYLLRGSSPSIVESGTAASAGITLAALRQADACSPQFIFLTHIHLDHAGGAGHLARAFPKTKIVVHERGARHLSDPRKLLEGVRLAAPDLFRLYGEPLPIPASQLVPVSGGEVFDLAEDVRLEVIATPGHAPHHVCYYEQYSQTLFTGDAVGNWSNPVDVPLTVLPRFDLNRGQESLQTLQSLAPKYLAFTHFGITGDALDHLRRYEKQLVEWFNEIRELLQTLEPETIVEHILNRPCYRGLPEIECSLIAMCVHGAIRSIQTDSA